MLNLLKHSSFLLLALFVASCSQIPGITPTPTPVPSCASESATFVAQAQATIREWDDAIALAGTTARINLSPQIEKLQGLRRAMEGAAAPACAKRIQALAVHAMNGSISGFLEFAAQNDALATIKLASATADLKVTVAALEGLAAGRELGAGVTRDAFQQAYPKAAFVERTVQETLVFAGISDDITLEVFGSSDNVTHATILVNDSAGSTTYTQDQIKAFASQFAPDWIDRDAWIVANATKNMGNAPTVFMAGTRTISITRISVLTTGTQTYAMTVYFL